MDQHTEFAYALRDMIDTFVQDQTILFNGDLIDPERSFQESVQRLDTIINILRRPGRRKLIFVPGDRDWADSGPQGWAQVQLIEDYIRQQGYDDVLWPLERGCPGPQRVSLDLTLNLIAVNTQWWNHPYDKPRPASADCKYSTHEEVLEEIKSDIEDAGYGNLIIAGHYPVHSNGMYGGRFPWYRWLLPVPGVNTMITAYKQNIGTARETCNERFGEFKEGLEDIMKEYTSIFYMSGHERNREVLSVQGSIMINSGNPVVDGYIKPVRETLFASSRPGVVITHYDVDGNVFVEPGTYLNGVIRLEALHQVMQAPGVAPLPYIPINKRLVPYIAEQYVLTEMGREHPDSMVVVANHSYEMKRFGRKMLGDHYRDTWTSQVTVPVLNLDTYRGGLVPYAIGGGRQTMSLKFIGEDGYNYVFRSVDKDPSGALNYDLRETIVSLALRDQTTTQHPYGAVVVSSLLDSLGILHATPRVYLMPDDEKLGPFRDQFGGMLGLLEEFPTGSQSIDMMFGDADDIKRSVGMFRDLYEDNRNFIAEHEFATARMFDLLVGDWGRHEDNWKWAAYETPAGSLYRPIPRDRDQAFSRWDGVLPWIADREWAKPSGENFGNNVKGMRSLTWQSRHMDRFIGSELDAADWQHAAERVQTKIDTNAIKHAVELLPKGSDAAHVKDIKAKLIVRKDKLKDMAADYYAILAKQVDVVGSVENEDFQLVRGEDGTVHVCMFDASDDQRIDTLYSRRFYPDETKEIRLFGLLGDDNFMFEGVSKHSILVRVVPGIGNDTLADYSVVESGKKMTLLYARGDCAIVADAGEVDQVKIPYDQAYQYNRTSFTYNTYLPYGLIYFSPDNGLQFTAGANFIRQAYNKPDFSAIHNLTARVSTQGNFQFTYEGIYRHSIARWDMTANFEANQQNRFNYFFGLGNESEKDDDLRRADFYTLKNSFISAEVGLRRIFWKRSIGAFGAGFASYSQERGEDNILDDDLPDNLGGKPLRIGKFNWLIDMDLRDRAYLPNQGMRFMAQGYLAELFNDDGSYSLSRVLVEWFGTARPFTLGVKAGGWVHTGTPPYYDLAYLGQSTNLRGYRQNRFTGQRAIFVNTDLRVQILDHSSGIVPFKLGLLFFYDLGRVYLDEEISHIWHQGYGVGIYAVPIRERYVLGLSLGFSEEETALIRFAFGKAF